jgi:hypothetical protein
MEPSMQGRNNPLAGRYSGSYLDGYVFEDIGLHIPPGTNPDPIVDALMGEYEADLAVYAHEQEWS